MASPSSPFARIVNTSHVFVSSDVSEAFYYKLQEGDTVEVQFPNTKEGPFKTVVEYKGNYINASNRTFKIHVRLDKAKRYPPNLLSVVRINEVREKDAFVIDRLLVKQDNKGKFIYTVRGEKGEEEVHKIRIETKDSYKGGTWIVPEDKNELTKDTPIITEGHKNVEEGVLVRIK
jgi:multidrug efflux pump subunit AcrA (membrane-fusion protein)